MEIPAGAERFTFPLAQPTPPYTPVSSQSRHSSDASQASPLLRKRMAGYFTHSPPAYLHPQGDGFQFSYTPPIRDTSSESSDSSDSSSSEFDINDMEQPLASKITTNKPSSSRRRDEDSVSDAGTATTDHSLSRIPAYLFSVNAGALHDFILEEMSDGSFEYDTDTEVLKPDMIEYAESSRASRSRVSLDDRLADRLKDLHCADHEQSQEFEAAQKARYRRKKKRWSRGHYYKRSHAESIGSDTDDDDIEPLDDQSTCTDSRRLRRRTEGREDIIRPRTSLLFDDPPAEIEELKYLDRHLVNLPPIVQSEVDENTDSSDEDDDDDDIDDVVEIEEDFTVPYWLYRMEIDLMTGGSTPDAELYAST